MNIKQIANALLLSTALAIGSASCSDDRGSSTDYGDSGFSTQARTPSCLCGPNQARNMGRLLFQSNPLIEVDSGKWNTYVQWIGSNAQLLARDGPTMACARDLGNAFTNYGIKSFAEADYDGSYGRVLEMGGSMDDARAVADSMTSGSLDAYMTGQELLWLSQVIPSAAAGNWEPFMTTGTQTRLQFRQIIPILQQSGLGADLQQFAPFIDQFGPMVEDQMVMAACLFQR